MKLSKTTAIALTSASALIYGFGVVTVQVSAQEVDILTSEVSSQIQASLGSADSDELLVDALSQVEAQLREYGVSSFAPTDSDSSDIAELKQLRRSYLLQLRQRLNSASEEDKQAFLQKIRLRRQEVRQELSEIRNSRKLEFEKLREEKKIASQEELEARREQFKTNLEARLEAVQKSKLPAEVKFQERLEAKQSRLEEQQRLTEAQKANLKKRDKLDYEKVKGAIDYQPSNIFEKIGYWLAGV